MLLALLFYFVFKGIVRDSFLTSFKFFLDICALYFSLLLFNFQGPFPSAFLRREYYSITFFRVCQVFFEKNFIFLIFFAFFQAFSSLSPRQPEYYTTFFCLCQHFSRFSLFFFIFLFSPVSPVFFSTFFIFLLSPGFSVLFRLRYPLPLSLMSKKSRRVKSGGTRCGIGLLFICHIISEAASLSVRRSYREAKDCVCRFLRSL